MLYWEGGKVTPRMWGKKKAANYQYVVGGADGKDLGPYDLKQVKALCAQGKLTGATLVKRSDQEHWSTAAEFPEINARDDVGGENPFASDAVAQEQATLNAMKPVRLGAKVFLLIAAYTLFGVIGSSLHADFGLSGRGLWLTELFSALGQSFGYVGRWVGIILNLAVVGGYVYAGLAVFNNQIKVYSVALMLYTADTLLIGLVHGPVSTLVHAVPLIWLGRGYYYNLEAAGRKTDAKYWVKWAGATVGITAVGLVLFLVAFNRATSDMPQ